MRDEKWGRDRAERVVSVHDVLNDMDDGASMGHGDFRPTAVPRGCYEAATRL